jgi:CheY-like chemotaxis protein
MNECHPLESSSLESRLPCRILVVEDDSIIRQLNEEWLTGEGYRVDVVPDGEAGWEALQLHDYDLMITDNSMPKMTGLELITKLHSTGLSLPVILASGGLSHKELKWSQGLQPAVILAKPYSKILLLNAVSGVLHTSERARPDVSGTESE